MSSYEFTFKIIVTIIISVFVPERSRAGTNPLFQFLYQHVTVLVQKLEIIIVKIIVRGILIATENL